MSMSAAGGVVATVCVEMQFRALRWCLSVYSAQGFGYQEGLRGLGFRGGLLQAFKGPGLTATFAGLMMSWGTLNPKPLNPKP